MEGLSCRSLETSVPRVKLAQRGNWPPHSLETSFLSVQMTLEGIQEHSETTAHYKAVVRFWESNRENLSLKDERGDGSPPGVYLVVWCELSQMKPIPQLGNVRMAHGMGVLCNLTRTKIGTDSPSRSGLQKELAQRGGRDVGMACTRNLWLIQSRLSQMQPTSQAGNIGVACSKESWQSAGIVGVACTGRG